MSAESYALFDSEPEYRKPDDFEPGIIVDAYPIDPATLGFQDQPAPSRIESVVINDPYVAYMQVISPGLLTRLQHQESVMNGAARMTYRLQGWRRGGRRNVIAYEDQATPVEQDRELDQEESIEFEKGDAHKKYFAPGQFLGDASSVAWQSTVPSAIALASLANPSNLTEVPDRKGAMHEVSQQTRDWLTACTDGQEIRNRSAIMINRMGGFLAAHAERHPDEPTTVVSVAGGTALPTMQAIMRSGVPDVRLLLLEGDEKSAALSLELAKQIGFTGQIEIRKTDVFSPSDMQAVRDELDASGAKVAAVDAVGIVEYSSELLRTDAKARRFGEDNYLFNPSEFVRAVVNLVDDDGMAMIGQMRADRPRPYFTRGIIGWPTICMRSVRRFAGVLSEGGVDMEDTEVTLTTQGVYAMASIYKRPKNQMHDFIADLDAIVSLRQSVAAGAGTGAVAAAASLEGEVLH